MMGIMNQSLRNKTLAEQAVGKKKRRRALLAKMKALPAKQWVNVGEVLFLIILFVINFWLLRPFFGREDIMNSFSAPLIPFLANLFTFILPLSYAVRLWLLIFFLLLPFGFYFFIREISSRFLSACLASLLISLPIGVFLFSRVKLGFLEEDGAQIASLSLSMFSCLFLLKFLRQGQFKWSVITSVGIALVALISPLGLAILFCFCLAITFSEILLGQARLKLVRFIIALVVAAGLVAFWYSPQFVLNFLGSSQFQLLKKVLANFLPLSFFAVPVLAVFGFLIFESRPHLQSLFLAVFLAFGFGSLALGTGFAYPMPLRFLPVFGLCLAFLLGVVLMKGLDWLIAPWWHQRISWANQLGKIRKLLLVGLFLALFVCIFAVGNNFRDLASNRVLGISNLRKAGIWEIRKDPQGVTSWIGHGITTLTIAGVIMVKTKFKLTSGRHEQANR